MVGEEMHEDNLGPLRLLQGVHKRPRSGARAADEDLVARPYDRDRFRGQNLAVTPLDCRLDTHAGLQGERWLPCTVPWIDYRRLSCSAHVLRGNFLTRTLDPLRVTTRRGRRRFV
jgi:hypothetical protein